MNFLRDSFMTAYKNRLYPNYWDIVALLFVIGIITLLAWDAKQMAAPYHVGQSIAITLDPHHLPRYAMRTVLRMFIALICSLLFTFIFGTWAAKSHRAEQFIIPVIDICQSIPILGFLSAAIVTFIAIFPGSMLGPECAAIFAIFTSQAWNMALGFYQTVRSVPDDLREAASMYHLSSWQSFWRIDVPFSMPGLLWNMMMSMSAGWFFVVASEAISVANQEIMLPGIGSYIALAIQTANMHAIGYAIFTMFIVILLYDQVLFRPLVAWSEKFKAVTTPPEQEPYSWVINLFQRTRLLRYFGGVIKNMFDGFVNLSVFHSKPFANEIPKSETVKKYLSWFWNGVLMLLVVAAIVFAVYFIFRHLPLSEVGHVLLLSIYTGLRIVVIMIFCSLVWVPIGVWVGMRPNVAQYVQPIAQFLASFPANLLYPLVVILIVQFHLNVEIWVAALMMLGVQWYVLFNVIAGASLIPKDLIQATDNFGLTGWLRWKRFILPAIFPYYVTGAIAAVGGAWNASIVAEVISWGQTKLVAKGIGAYIAEQTNLGDFLHMALGITMMCLIVLVLNRLFWRPLYVTAISRYRLEL